MREAICYSVDSAIEAIQFMKRKESIAFIENVALRLSEVFQRGNKVLIAGNGGSLCDAMHFAEELTGYFREKRRAFPAMALSDPAHMTCVANDTHFDQVFQRGVEAFGQKGDALVVLSTSGNSRNLLRAIHQAKVQDLLTIAFLGKEGGEMKGLCSLEWIVRGFETSDRIQEVHMSAIHIIIEMIERELIHPQKKTKERLIHSSI